MHHKTPSKATLTPFPSKPLLVSAESGDDASLTFELPALRRAVASYMLMLLLNDNVIIIVLPWKIEPPD